MKRIYFFVLLFFIVFSFGYLFYNHPVSLWQKDGKKIHVVASFYPLYYFASQIAGDRIAIKNITPAGVEPHDYEPTAQDIVSIENSNLFILNGGGLESWGKKVQGNLTSDHTMVISVGQNLANKNFVVEGKSIVDPHVWLDPVLAGKEVDSIAKALVAIDPGNASLYEANASLLEEKLNMLDLTYSSGLRSCKVRDFVTSHAAFGYLAERYNLNQVSIAGLSPDEEPSTQKLVETASLVREKKISYIFFESLISSRLSETIASETGAKTLVLDPIEGLSEKDISSGKNYFTQMEMNLKNLQLALQCER